MRGWFKVPRDIKNHWIWEDPIKLKKWITILMEVNYIEGKIPLGNKIVQVKRGSSAKSIRTWSNLFNCGTKATTNFFELLEDEGMITRSVIGKGKHSTTLINITNYEEYQAGEETLGNTLTSTQTQREQHTIEESNKENIVKKERKKFIPPSQEDVIIYLKEIGLAEGRIAMVEAEKFIDHYKSNGWMVGGKAKMQDWNAAVRNWMKRDFKIGSGMIKNEPIILNIPIE